MNLVDGWLRCLAELCCNDVAGELTKHTKVCHLHVLDMLYMGQPPSSGRVNQLCDIE